MGSQQIILADGLIYLLTFIYWLTKLRKLNAGLIILAIMTISHIGAYFYYDILIDMGGIMDITIIPFLFLYLMIMLNLYPFLTNDGIKRIDTSGNENFIYILSWVIILISIEPFLENLKLLLTSHADYADLYDDTRNSESHIYSGIGTRFMRWANFFRLFVPIAFFYYLSKAKKKMWLLSGLFMCMINYILNPINLGTRGGIVSQFFMYFFCFVLFIPLFSISTIKKLKKIIIVSTIPLILAFATITVSRYNAGSSNKTLAGWLLLYTSEGPIKFNNEMWGGNHNTKGDVNLCYLKSLVGLKTYTEFEERDTHYLAKNGRRIEVFYTYVGDFVSDFGIFGAFITCLLLFLLTKFFLRKDRIIRFQDLFFIIFMLHMLSIGFASNIYRSNYMQKGNFYLFLIFILMYILPKIRGTRKTHNNLRRMKYDLNSDGNL